MGSDAAVAPGLIRMMRSGHGLAQLYAAQCLQRCSGVESLGALMLQPGEADSTKTTVVMLISRAWRCSKCFAIGSHSLLLFGCRCVWLPLQRDFVVIALLRVNNDEIKEICARAFFNLLKPEATRAAMVDSAQVGLCPHALVGLGQHQSILTFSFLLVGCCSRTRMYCGR
jgi:hypothetical protein